MAKRYADDPDDDPPHGRRVKKAHWKGAGKRVPPELSVNCAECVRCPTCSIALNTSAERYYHVLELDLAAIAYRLRETTPPATGREAHDPVARYSPLTRDVDGFDNPCHFDLVSENTSNVGFILALYDVLEELFDEKVIPREGREEKFAIVLQAHEDCAPSLHEYVRDEVGELRWVFAP